MTDYESDAQREIRLRASAAGIVLWRNNSGVLLDANGRPVRYGLANDSPALNAVLKSSDLIGVGPHGRFLAIECKPKSWTYKATIREKAQWNFIKAVQERGGLGCFATSWEDVIKCLKL